VVAFARSGEDSGWTVMSAAPDGRDERLSEVVPTPGELLHLEASDSLNFPAGTPGHSYFADEHLPTGASRVVFPLRENGRIQATLVIARDDGSPFSLPALQRGRQLAGQLAIGLANVALLGELDALSHGSMLALARSIDAASPWTAGHSERVTHGALEIGRRLGFDRSTLDLLRRGGLLHDIGKIGVPASILDKPARLTDEERKVIEAHPVIGAEIIKPIAAFRELRPLILYHHELLDGSGYPDGLSGESIPMMVRVLTVADVFDALVSDRPYRAGLTPARALEILREGVPRKFDTGAVQALENALQDGWSTMTLAAAGAVETAACLPESNAPELNVPEEVLT
jgi:putative nucleotidyltransferase with HDIG domain